MTNLSESITCKGNVKITLHNIETGEDTVIHEQNTVLTTGKAAIVRCLSNEIGTVFNLYFSKMLFGTSGTSGGVPKIVEASRTGLFSSTLLSKNVLVSVTDSTNTTIICTAVITSSEGNGSTINEILLQLSDETPYSMVTLGGFAKTSTMQVTIAWSITFI